MVDYLALVAPVPWQVPLRVCKVRSGLSVQLIMNNRHALGGMQHQGSQG